MENFLDPRAERAPSNLYLLVRSSSMELIAAFADSVILPILLLLTLLLILFLALSIIIYSFLVTVGNDETHRKLPRKLRKRFWERSHMPSLRGLGTHGQGMHDTMGSGR